MTPEIPGAVPNTIRRVKRFAPLQLGKMLCVLYGLMGLIFVPFFLLMALLPAMIPGQRHGPASGQAITLAFGLGMAIVMPVMYAAMGFIFGVVGAWIYNVVAKWIGGIEVEVE